MVKRTVGRPKLVLFNGLIRDLSNAGYGTRKIEKLLASQGFYISRRTIQKRIFEMIQEDKENG